MLCAEEEVYVADEGIIFTKEKLRTHTANPLSALYLPAPQTFYKASVEAVFVLFMVSPSRVLLADMHIYTRTVKTGRQGSFHYAPESKWTFLSGSVRRSDLRPGAAMAYVHVNTHVKQRVRETRKSRDT